MAAKSSIRPNTCFGKGRVKNLAENVGSLFSDNTHPSHSTQSLSYSCILASRFSSSLPPPPTTAATAATALNTATAYHFATTAAIAA